MKKILLLLCFPFWGYCQNTIGLPDVVNYSKQAYSAGLQSWDIKQDKNGIIYFANNEGLLSFDGKYWNLYPLPNKTIVRSVEITADGRIYTGGQDELGYFYPGSNGRLQYHSLTSSIPEKERVFGDVWDIVSFGQRIYFRSATKIFSFGNHWMATYKPGSEWAFMGICNGRLYAQDFKSGLMRFENDAWVPLSSPLQKNILPVNDPVTAILPAGRDSALVTTLKNGLFTLTATGVAKLASPSNSLFENDRIYAAAAVNAEWIALATNNSGVYITDHKGNIIQRFSRTEGMQNNNVLSIFPDRQGNLWLGLDNGIDMVAYNSAIKQVKPFLQDGSGYASIIYNNRLYAGTSGALYSVELQAVKDLSFSKGNFEPVSNTKGQTWSLTEINGQLLLGHHDGAFTIKNNMAVPISLNNGFWNFVPMSATFPSSQVLSGNYRGIAFFNYSNGTFAEAAQLPAFIESCRFTALDGEGNIWVSHPYHGVYKLWQAGGGSGWIYRLYTDKDGLPSTLNNHVYKIKNELLVATEKGVYMYNRLKNNFEASPFYQKLFGNRSVRYLKEDAAGNTWFIHEKTLGVVDFSAKEPATIYLPELNNKMLSGFEFIYPVNQNNIFIGGEKGFFHINYEKYKQTIPGLQVQVRTVSVLGEADSLLFGGYYKDTSAKLLQDAIPRISNGWKTIRIEFSASLFDYQSNLEYSYRLKGFDDKWSEWLHRTEKEYTNLPPGNYIFEVKVRNNLGNESAITAYAFATLPPWYLTIWAKLLYFLLFVAGIYLLYRWQQKKFGLQQAKYETEQKKLQYIHELERSKTEGELAALRNEKLEAEINFKNSELASSAMHLVKKGELLSKVKGELSQVMKGFDNPQAATELKKMIKTLNEDDHIDQEWEKFAHHFDKVHSDFVLQLKDKHPTITPNELKLCAYLRMNLSTKEIAQLMNISVRGVEISRYRLRKKLGITSETSLFDYLINLGNKTG
jgi:ligand-binding sensor domain-containing protein/DNA-binding CsgD family transcriptional regulator